MPAAVNTVTVALDLAGAAGTLKTLDQRRAGLCQQLAPASPDAATAAAIRPAASGPTVAQLRDAARRNRLRRAGALRAQAAGKSAVDALEAEAVALRLQEGGAPMPRARRFLRERSEMLEVALEAQRAFEMGAEMSAEALRSWAGASHVLQVAEVWPAAASRIHTALPRLETEAAALRQLGSAGASIAALQDATAAAGKLFAAHSAMWLREAQRRSGRARLMEEFTADRDRLVEWCQQQAATLQTVSDPADVHEFCASFRTNTAVMQANFLVLLEMSEQLLPDANVVTRLVELADVWIGVELAAHDKLRATLMDEHAKSGLEQESRDWPAFAARFRKFLDDAEALLAIPTDDESLAVAAPLKEQCTKLQSDFAAHALIIEHLADFTMREQCLKPHFAAVKKTAVSRLSLLTQAFPGAAAAAGAAGAATGSAATVTAAFHRKQEQADRMAELGEWVEAKAQSGAWRELLGRVEGMRRMLDDAEPVASALPGAAPVV